MLIDFDSYNEFVNLLQKMVKNYKDLVLRLANDESTTMQQYKKDILMRNFVIDSIDFWYRFTKGQNLQWCKSQCNALAFMLVNTKIMYENSALLVTGGITLKSLLHTMVVLYFEACPNIYFPENLCCHFLTDAFSSIQRDIEEDSFEFKMKDRDQPLWLDDYFIPVKKYQEYQLATAMGTHLRLGQQSTFLPFTMEILQLIWLNV